MALIVIGLKLWVAGQGPSQRNNPVSILIQAWTTPCPRPNLSPVSQFTIHREENGINQTYKTPKNQKSENERNRMEVEVDEKELKAAGAEPLPDDRRGLRIHGWEIETRKLSILTSSNLQLSVSLSLSLSLSNSFKLVNSKHEQYHFM